MNLGFVGPILGGALVVSVIVWFVWTVRSPEGWSDFL